MGIISQAVAPSNIKCHPSQEILLHFQVIPEAVHATESTMHGSKVLLMFRYQA